MSFRSRYNPVNDFFAPVIKEAIDEQRKERENIVAWNYEKGCEEQLPYPNRDSIYTPPNWKNNAISVLAVKWEEAEAKATYYTKSKSTGTASLWRGEAIKLWKEIERAMLWDKAAEIADFRRRYIEWLSRATEIEVELGINDLDVDKLPLAERIIAIGYRELAKRSHPDTGGTTEEFIQLKHAKEQLDIIMMEVKSIL